MSLKFRLQLAGAELSQPSSPYRKWLRISLISTLSVLSVLGYCAYLHNLTHHKMSQATRVAPAVAVVPKAAAPQVPSPAETPTAPTLKKTAAEDLLAVANYLAPATVSPHAVESAPGAGATPKIYVPSPLAAHRLYRVHTDQERLVTAGQTAFDNVMDMANKYPDAYGFQANDFLSDAKLGEPIPVYTIAENDRVNYQAGQPVKPLLKQAKQWVFPISMGDRICCMVEVMQVGREYIPGKGSKSLAMAWNKIQSKWPAEDGYHPLLVVNSEVPGYYFTVPELPQQNLTDTIEMFYLHPGTSPADVILASWR